MKHFLKPHSVFCSNMSQKRPKRSSRIKNKKPKKKCQQSGNEQLLFLQDPPGSLFHCGGDSLPVCSAEESIV